jgi:hypothetical protein
MQNVTTQGKALLRKYIQLNANKSFLFSFYICYNHSSVQRIEKRILRAIELVTCLHEIDIDLSCILCIFFFHRQ